MILQEIFKNVGKYEKSNPANPKVRKWNPGVSNSFQKGAKREPKGAEREPKGAKREPKGAEGEPKGDQNASKNRSSEMVAKSKDC